MDNRFYFGFNTSEERKKRRKAELYSMSEQVSTFFWDEAPQHGLEMREGQQDMSFEIVDALINDQHFAIEAGVGIGKSFGYLVPVLLYSKRMNKPVIIATSTIAQKGRLGGPPRGLPLFWGERGSLPKRDRPIISATNAQMSICVTRKQTHRTRSKKESSKGMRNARISRRFCRKESGTR